MRRINMWLPTDLLDWLGAAARREHRSMTRQLVVVLEQARAAEQSKKGRGRHDTSRHDTSRGDPVLESD